MKKIKLSLVLFSLAAACTAFGYADCARCAKDSCERKMNSGDRDMRMNRMNNDNDMRMNRGLNSDRDIYANRNVHLQIDTDKEMYRGSDAERNNMNKMNMNVNMDDDMDSDMDMSSDKMVSLDVDKKMNMNRPTNIDAESRSMNMNSDRMGSDVNAPRPASMPADESGTSGDLDRSVHRSVRYDSSRNMNAPVVDKSIQGFDY